MYNLLENHYYAVLFSFLSFVFAGNIPLGIIRSRYPKMSRPWARCIYVPILVNIILRRILGLTFKVIPLVVIALLAGQFIGVRLQNFKKVPESAQ